MSILNIVEGERAGARLVVSFAGESNTGKTLTAILFAFGLANYNAKKLGFMCTENRRGRLYADCLPNKEKFFMADFYPPFSPERYIEAIDEFLKIGVEVLVMDQASYEWSGIGGCLEIAAKLKASNPKQDPWHLVTPRHEAFVKHMLQSPMHIVVCLRAKEKVRIEKVKDEDGKLKTTYVKLGVQPIQRDNFKYELTASLLMHDEGKRQTAIKVPKDLKPFLGRENGYITSADGKAVRDWVDAGGRENPEVGRWRDILILTSEKGVAELERVWTKEVPKEIKKELGKGFIDTQKEAALAFDTKRSSMTGNSIVDKINSGNLNRDNSSFEIDDDDDESEDQDNSKPGHLL